MSKHLKNLAIGATIAAGLAAAPALYAQDYLSLSHGSMMGRDTMGEGGMMGMMGGMMSGMMDMIGNVRRHGRHDGAVQHNDAGQGRPAAQRSVAIAPDRATGPATRIGQGKCPPGAGTLREAAALVLASLER
jgi:hypothetical protein